MLNAPRHLMLQRDELALFALTTHIGRDGSTARAHALELVNLGVQEATLVGLQVHWVRQDGVNRCAEIWTRHPLPPISKCVLLHESDLTRLTLAAGDASLHTDDGLRHVTLTVATADGLKELTFTYENWGNCTPHLAVELSV